MTLKTALRELHYALLDLQNSDYNTYQRPIQRLAAALRSNDLEQYTNRLKKDVDLDAFIAAADRGGGMAGSASLNWPVDRLQELGLTIALIERGAENPDWFMNLALEFYHGGQSIVSSIRKLISSVLIPFNRDFAVWVQEQAPRNSIAQPEQSDLRRVFIVHGHDEAPRETVARFLATLGLDPVILHEQANRGMTIPEKLIAHANVGFAVVLLTPDDVGRSNAEEQERPRARQNVILELGYFVGRLGRDRVCALLKGSLEIPSDYMGVVYTPFDDGGGWRQNLARELQAADYAIDWNTVMR